MLLEIYQNKVVVTLHALLDPAIRVIWDRDTSEKRSEAIRELSYIAYYLDPYASNPYREYSGYAAKDIIPELPEEDLIDANYENNEYRIENTERHGKIVERIFKDIPGWEMDEELREAFDAYKILLNSASRSLSYLDSLEMGVDKLKDFYVNKLDFDATTNAGNQKYKPSEIQKAIGEAFNLLNSLSDIRDKVLQEIKEDVKTRKGREIGFYEDPANSETALHQQGKYGT